MAEKQAEPRQRIVEAAATAFGELGFAGARIDDIAARAGVNKATVYYHVGGKEQLYATVFEELLDTALLSLRTSLEDVAEPEDRFSVIVRTISSMAVRFPHFAPLILREVAAGGSSLPEEVLQKMASILGIVADVLRQGTEEGKFRPVDPLVTHMMVAGGTFFLMAGAPIRTRMRKIVGSKAARKEPSPAELSEIIASLIIDGLSSKTKSARAKRKSK